MSPPLHNHPVPESTIEEFLTNTVQSFLDRGNGRPTTRGISTAEELVATIAALFRCPVCSPELRKPLRDRVSVLYKKLYEGAKVPLKAYADDAGFDLFCLYSTDLPPGRVTEVRSG